jgi:hypothetical protein
LKEMILRFGFRLVESERHRISHTFLCR